MPEHDVIPLGEIHIAYNWSYANTAARTGATGFIAADVGKFARQLDDNSIWMLTATTPTWAQVGGPPGAGGLGDVVGPASATDHAISRFDTTTGKLIQDSAVTVDDAGAITVPEIAAPATPSAGKVSLYAKADGLLYSKDDVGTETLVSGGAGGGAGYAGVTTGGTGSLDFAQGTKTASEPFIDATATWNQGATVFEAIKVNITDTASAATSSLLDLQVGAASKFKVFKSGQIQVQPGGAGANSAIQNASDTDTGIFFDANTVAFNVNGFQRFTFSESGGLQVDTVGCQLTASLHYRWTSSTRLLAPSNGQLRIDGNSNGQGDRLILGTVDASGAMIKRNATRLEAKLGGDSAYTQFTCEKLGVNNSAVAATLGSVTKKMEVFDAAGASLGFVAIYDAIT